MSSIIRIRGQDVNVDIERELQDYDWGSRATWSSNKLIASSPFRDDNAPSFFVNLSGEYAGVWGDSGAIDAGYDRGGFVRLLAYLREETEEVAENYLLETYGEHDGEGGSRKEIRIRPPKLRERDRYNVVSNDVITPAISPYLLTRGISAEAQTKHGTGYNVDHKGWTAIPWKIPDGRVGNVKYRNTRYKRFFYERGATPVGRLVYGIELIAEDYAIICEGEIDAMSWTTAGIPAISVGKSSITEEQAEMIRRSSIRNLYLGGDNDDQGRKLNRQVGEMLRKDMRFYGIDYGIHNDANDVLMSNGVEGLRELVENTSEKWVISLS